LARAEIVDIEVREPTAQLVLNAVAMTLNAASIDNEPQSAASHSMRPPKSPR
jgi:hypothetical protein